MIHPVDSVIHLSNNKGLFNYLYNSTKCELERLCYKHCSNINRNDKINLAVAIVHCGLSSYCPLINGGLLIILEKIKKVLIFKEDFL